MKSQEMSAALAAFSPLAEGQRSNELRTFASIFSGGKTETVAARLKRIPPQLGLPSSLKESLSAICEGLTETGAKKQAEDVKATLAKFNGPFDGTLDATVALVQAALVSPRARGGAGRRGGRAAQPDEALAKQLADELSRTVLDSGAFARVVERLKDSRQVTTPTLAAIGNRFLGNSKAYKGRKAVIVDISKRQGRDALDAARSKALGRVGV